jgi:hypothetical protein
VKGAVRGEDHGDRGVLRPGACQHRPGVSSPRDPGRSGSDRRLGANARPAKRQTHIAVPAGRPRAGARATDRPYRSTRPDTRSAGVGCRVLAPLAGSLRDRRSRGSADRGRARSCARARRRALPFRGSARAALRRALLRSPFRALPTDAALTGPERRTRGRRVRKCTERARQVVDPAPLPHLRAPRCRRCAAAAESVFSPAKRSGYGLAHRSDGPG